MALLTLQWLVAATLLNEAAVGASGRRTDDHVIGMADVFKCVELFDFSEERLVLDLFSELLVGNVSATPVRTADEGIGGQILTIENFLNPE